MKKIVSLSIAIVLLFVFAACGGGGTTEAAANGEPVVLTAEEFSFYLDGQESVKLDMSSKDSYFSMDTQNSSDGVAYSTKRGLSISNDALTIPDKYGDVNLNYSIIQYGSGDTELQNKRKEYAEKYKTVKDYISNEVNMDLMENENIFVSYSQYADDSGVYTKAQVDEKCGYKANMTEDEQKAYYEKVQQYDYYHLSFDIKDGKIKNIQIGFKAGGTK